MLLLVRVPVANERGLLNMQQALAALHQQQIRFFLEYATCEGEVLLVCSVCVKYADWLTQQLFAQYPDAQIERLPDDAIETSTASITHVSHLSLYPDLIPLKQPEEFADALARATVDPVAVLLASLDTGRFSDLTCRVTLQLRPACFIRLWWHQIRFRAYRHRKRLGWFGVTDGMKDLEAADRKRKGLLFEVRLKITVGSTSPQPKNKLSNKAAEIAGAFGAFLTRRDSRFRLHRRPRTFLLSVGDTASLWHSPLRTVEQPSLDGISSRDRPPPLQIPDPRKGVDATLLGVTKFRSTWKKFGILSEDRFRHLFLCGKTGQGKSTLLERLITSDIHAGKGIGVIDPHGDLLDALLPHIPKERTNDVVLFDPTDRDYSPSFNVLHCPRPQDRSLVASAVLTAFKKVFADSWGPRLEYYLRNALLAVLEIPDATLLTLFQFIVSPQTRQSIARRIQNPIVRSVWLDEFPRKPVRLQEESLSPIQNKIGPLVSSPILCNIVGQPRGRIDLRTIMDSEKILLVNLSKGKLGDDVSQLLGAFLVSSIQLAAMSRADQPPDQRAPFFLYVDEFQNIATESFATILSEARKYRLALTVANQYLDQLDDATRSAVFGNVGSVVCFQAGATDAEILCEQLGSDLTPQDLMTIPKYQAYMRLLIDGHPSRPFSMKTLKLKPPPRFDRRIAVIRRTSRHRYSRPAQAVQQHILEGFRSEKRAS